MYIFFFDGVCMLLSMYLSSVFIFTLNCCFTNLFCLLKSTENSKKRKSNTNLIVVLFHTLVWMSQYLCLCVYIYAYVRFHVKYVWRALIIKNGIIVWLGVIISQSLEKGTLWKFWLDPRFPRNSKSKWALKWLSLNRGYFKSHFWKGENLLKIPGHTYFSTCKYIVLF